VPEAGRLWSDALRDVPADVTSDVIEDGNRRWAFTALGTTATVWSFDGEAWGRERRIPLALPATNLNGRIVTTDLTGDGHGDALIPLLGNGFVGTVLSNDGGDWRVIPFAWHGTSADSLDNVEVQGRDLVTYENVCDPSCADGAADEVTWVYDVASASFVEHDRVQVSASSTASSTSDGPTR
jgi:hypothetical protein